MNQATQYFDYFITGQINSKGEIKSVFDSDAIENALLIWLCSKPNEYINNPNYGGWLYLHLCKPMNENRTLLIQHAIIQGLDKDFYPALTITQVDVIPDFINRHYLIQVFGYCNAIGSTFSISNKFRNFS